MHWSVVSPTTQEEPDVSPSTGQTVIVDGSDRALIEFELLADDVPELDETFSVVLTSVGGGAELADPELLSAAFTVM